MTWTDGVRAPLEGFELHSVSTDGEGTVKSERYVRAGRDPTSVQQMPDPAFISRLSTNFDATGKVRQQWVIQRPEDQQREMVIREWAKAMAEGLPQVKPILPPVPAVNRDLLNVYPIGDHHMGMLSWRPETGAHYDIDISEQLLLSAINHLSEVTPRAETALVVFLGDFMHYDSMVAKTPTNNNPLDADGRFPKMVRAALRTMRYVIEKAASKHNRVRVIIEIGNHDLASSVWAMESLLVLYADNPRIEIDASPSHFHYYHFDRVLIGTHHGDGAKMAELPQIMANDRQVEWGQANHRHWFTGHIHTRTAQDFQGCSVESFRILAPNDAWAANKGYRSKRDMKALVFHREHGEVARYTVNPAMLEASK